MPTLLTAAGLYLLWTRILWPLIKAFFRLFALLLLSPFAIIAWLSERSERHASQPIAPPATGRRNVTDASVRQTLRSDLVSPPPAPQATGDWRQDQETLRRMIAEGQIR